jgi:hypothetical protein
MTWAKYNTFLLPPSFVVPMDHSFLKLRGESRLRNPLRGNLHGGI